MYCPICRSEYREGFTYCSECHAGLVEELPEEQIPDDVNPVTVFEGDSSSAVVICTMLKSAGIEAWIKDEEEHGVLPNLGPVEVLVTEGNRKAALAALESSQHDSSVLDNSTSPPCCNTTVLRDERKDINNTSRRQDKAFSKKSLK